MLGIVLVTHGRLGAELLSTAEGIVGPIEGARALSVDPAAQVEALRAEMQRAIKDVDAGDGVLVLTDMFGGTPANIALSLLEEQRVEVVTGINLPMVVKLGTSREDGLTLLELAKVITAYGQKNIVFASGLLNEGRKEQPR